MADWKSDMERKLKERDEAEEKREAERRALQKRKEEKEKQLRDKEHATAVENINAAINATSPAAARQPRDPLM